jgi:hypothetical protein
MRPAMVILGKIALTTITNSVSRGSAAGTIRNCQSRPNPTHFGVEKPRSIKLEEDSGGVFHRQVVGFCFTSPIERGKSCTV